MDAMYEKLADAIEKSNKAYDIPRIRAAYELAKKAHEGQMRSSGDPYISHPIAVAVILVGLGMDSDTIIGGLLHDVVEDTTVTLEDIEKQFGGDVAELVDGVTKLANIPYSSRAEQQAENVRKMLLAMARMFELSSSSWPTGCTTCARWIIAFLKSSGSNRWRRWRSMRRWRTGWVSAVSRKSWRISL